MIEVLMEGGIATFEEVKRNEYTIAIRMVMNGNELIHYAVRENYLDLQTWVESKFECEILKPE